MRVVYYAHCLAIFNTPQEERDITLLERLGYSVFNPNCKYCADGYKAFGMEFFDGLVKECDVFAFRALPDGRIPAGVAKEIEFARKYDKPVIELPSGVVRREMNALQTREYLSESGQR